MGQTNYDWAALVCQYGGWPSTGNNITFFTQWMASEEPPSNWWNRNNPLNNGFGSGGGAGLGAYPDLNTSAKNVALNLVNPNNPSTWGYGAIVANLAANADPAQTAKSVWNSAWAQSHYADTDANGNPIGPYGTHWHSGTVPVVTATYSFSDSSAVVQGGGTSSGAASPTLLAPQAAFNQGVSAVVSPPTYSSALLPTANTSTNLPGFGELSVGNIVINGQTLSVDISNAIQDVVVERSIGNASTVTIQFTDPKRAVLRSGIFTFGATLVLDGLRFGLAQIIKSADTLECVFEAMGVFMLRQQYGQLASTSTTDIASFCLYLVNQANQAALSPASGATYSPFTLGLGFVADASLTNASWAPNLIIGRGTQNDVLEDSWTAMVRMATTAGVRIFESDNTIYLGSDEFFTQQNAGGYGPGVQGPISEFTEQAQFIDFDWAYGQPFGNLTVTATTGLWDYAPGTPVVTQGMGTPIDSTPTKGQTLWLVYDMQRDLYRPQATITLTVPMTPIQQIEAASGYTSASVPFDLTPGNPGAGTPSITVNLFSGTTTTTPATQVAAGAPFTVQCVVSGDGLGQTPTGTVEFMSAAVDTNASDMANGKTVYNAVKLDKNGVATVTINNGYGPGTYTITCTYTPSPNDHGAPGGNAWASITSNGSATMNVS